MTGYLAVALIDLLVATFVLVMSRSKVAIAFSMLWTCFAIWSFNLYLATTITDVASLSPLFHKLRFGMFFIAPCMLIFFSLITRSKFSLLHSIAIGLSLATSAGIYGFNLLFYPSVLDVSAVGYSSAPDAISKIHEINFVTASVLSVLITLHAYKTAIFREKQRIKWLIVAIVVGSALGVLSFNNSKTFGMLGNIVGLSLMAYAVLRYHVVGVSEAIHTGIVKATAAIVVLVSFAFVHLLIQSVNLTAEEQLIATLMSVFLLLETYGRLVKFFNDNGRSNIGDNYNFSYTRGYLLEGLKNCSSPTGFILLTDEIFLKLVKVQDYSLHLIPKGDQADEQQILLLDPKLNHWPSTASLPPSPLTGTSLLQHMQHTCEPLYYDDAPSTLKLDFQQLNASVCLPLVNDGVVEGYALLGSPTKKAEFRRNDTKLIAWFGREAGLVLVTVLKTIELETNLNEAEKTLSVVSRLNGYNHDVKTPFSNIEALLLAKDVFSPEERHHKIMEQVVRGRSLVSTMTRILNGGNHTTKSHFNLNDLIFNIVNSFPTRSNLVTTDLAEIPLFYGHEEEIGILYLNLLNNAFEAQKHEDFNVQITTRFDPTTNKINCFFCDTGKGISEEKLQNIWDNPTSTKRATGGTGLGLSVIKRIVDDYDGSICVQSQEGHGTQFLISFPIQSAKITDIKKAHG